MAYARKLLFICSRNKWRSLTAENMYQGFSGYEARSAGTQPDARVRITEGLLGWADFIFMMEKSHLSKVREKFPGALDGKKVVVLHIPDDYGLMEPALIDELTSKLAEHVDVPPGKTGPKKYLPPHQTRLNYSMSYPAFSVSLAVKDAAKAIEFYKAAFGATEKYRLIDPQTGGIGHAEILIKESLLMLSDEYPQHSKSPKTLGGTTVRLALQSTDVDAEFKRAIEAGAEVIQPPHDQFYGHRSGCLRDPFGHEWMLFQEKEVISPEVMQQRWDSMAAKK